MQMTAAAIGRMQIPWRRIFQDFAKLGDNHAACLEALEENVGCYYIPPPPKRHVRRPSTMSEPEKIRLCSATVIIVPQNLLSQWHHEVAHHFTEDTFNVLSLDAKRAAAMPPGTFSNWFLASVHTICFGFAQFKDAFESKC